MTQITKITPPEVIFDGKVRIYRTPDGGMHIAYRKPGDKEDKHIPVPPVRNPIDAMALARKLQSDPDNPLAKMLAGFFGA